MDEEIDLRDRLRFAAGSLAADFGDELTADHAEALVFSSAEGLLASASVMEFVPILAERRARHAVRTGASLPDIASEPVPAVAVTMAEPELAPAPAVGDPEEGPTAAVAVPLAPSEPLSASTEREVAEPVMALPVDELDRLRDRVDRVRVRVSDWRADLDRR